MRLAELSIKRPVFISCIFLVILALGTLSYTRLSNELFPDVSFPVVNILVPFPGAGPEEVENQISMPIENALSGVAGLRTIRSTNLQGAGIVSAVFTLNADLRFSEQKVVQALAKVRSDLPSGIQEPTITTIDPSDVPIMTLALSADVPESNLYDLADREIRARLQQVPQVGLVTLKGGRRREIQVEVDRNALAARQMSMGEIANRVGMGGMNIPVGSILSPSRDTLVRWVAEFDSLDSLRKLPIRFVGNEAATTLGEVASVQDGMTDEQNRVYVGGKRALALRIYRQAGGDTIRIAQGLREEISKINSEFRGKFKDFDLAVVHDGTQPIHAGVKDATLSIVIGVILTVFVVYFFLGSVRSTLITGVALPNSLMGAFLLMWMAGFSINITTLAALSLAVGLLIDDAIVVRESIFRRIQSGELAARAAVAGTSDVALAVVATTLTVLSVFGPVAFLRGIIGQFFKEFGLTICFAMLISLLDSLTVAPMLSAYFAGTTVEEKATASSRWTRFQQELERLYLRSLEIAMVRPLTVLAAGFVVFALSFLALDRIPKSFVPPASSGEFQVVLDAPAGTSLDSMDRTGNLIESGIRQHAEVARTVLTVGGEHGETYQAQILVSLKGSRQRSLSTGEVKELIRRDLRKFPDVKGTVQDIFDIGGGAGQPFVLNITGQDLLQMKEVARNLMGELRKSGDLKDLDTSYREGAPALQFELIPENAREFGISATEAGSELRLFLAGAAPARFHEGGEQYDIRLRLKEDQRDLKKDFDKILIPNINHRLVPLAAVARRIEGTNPSVITRENRKRFIEVSADVDPKGRGLAHAVQLTRDLLANGTVKLPPGIGYEFAGQTRDFQDLLSSVILAIGISIGFMYLVLASLYESFFIPLTIMLVLPLAICGAFYALWLVHAPLEINSMIGCILLLGVAAKNSILLVDRIHQERTAGRDLLAAIQIAGKSRLRPIIMTSFALIAGMLPVAIPLEESAAQRSGMAIAVIGGLITSTLLTLVVVPAAYGYIERLENLIKRKI